MPEFPIVDSHVHLWDPTHFRMAWLDGNAKLNRFIGLADYRAQTAEAGVEIEAFVYLEVDLAREYKLLEAQWANARAAEDPRLQAVVASAPIEYGAQARAFLEALVAVGPRIKGVRRLIQAEPDPAFCIQSRFLEGLRLLPEFGLTFDICVYYPQLANAVVMVRECPETSFILDHIAKPNIREHQLDPWRRQIEELASLPNVICKVSGVVTEADHQHWTIEDIAPYVRHVLDTFGEDRVAFGGDWPVVLNAASYKQWVQALDMLTAHLSPMARRKLWADNARRFYRLPG